MPRTNATVKIPCHLSCLRLTKKNWQNKICIEKVLSISITTKKKKIAYRIILKKIFE